MSDIPVILAIDDEELFLNLIKSHLKSLGLRHHLELVNDGETAWEVLEAHPEKYDIILLDRMMPNMDGLELLKRIRSHWILRDIPVILQTAKSHKEDILEGMQAGAYYYLTKPFDKALINSVVETALRDRLQHKELKQAIKQRDESMRLIKKATFEYRTPAEANALAILLASMSNNPAKIVTGLGELLNNAVEHGNLEIKYEETTGLRKKMALEVEIQKRLSMPEYKNKVVKVEVVNQINVIEYTIIDEGPGFDWRPYLNFSPDRMMDNHGRGIAIANTLCFSSVDYKGKGNVVTATAR